tara:strand:+ start:1437 stop:1769 length:333 start_codon:yes stop_codon:yes gene_type:complete
MALIKFETTDAAKSEIIVDINVPVELSLVAVDRGTIAASDAGGATTLEIEWGTNWASIAEATELMTLMLNDAIEAAVADPYHIPVLSEICKAGGYLEPDECKSFTTYTYA